MHTDKKCKCCLRWCIFCFGILYVQLILLFVATEYERRVVNGTNGLEELATLQGDRATLDDQIGSKKHRLGYYDGWSNKMVTNWSNVHPSDLIHTHSGCCFARYVAHGSADCTWMSIAWPDKGVDCQRRENSGEIIDERNVHRLQSGDSVYVNLDALPSFVEKILPKLTVQIVLFASQWQASWFSHAHINDEMARRDHVTMSLLESDKILHFFLTNPYVKHPKMSGFPYGLKLKKSVDKCRSLESPFLDKYVRALAQVNDENEKQRSDVFFGYMKFHHHSRRGLPTTRKLEFSRYLSEMSKHKYALSPEGDRPDCYRHWEAIGLGVVPLTNLNSTIFDFIDGMVFDPNLTAIVDPRTANAKTECGLPSCDYGRVDRRQVLTQYWVERFRHLVWMKYGINMHFHDRYQSKGE